MFIWPNTTLEYLEHVVTREGVTADPTKVERMKSWAVPIDVKSLRGFLRFGWLLGGL